MADYFQHHLAYLDQSLKLMSGNRDPALDNGELPSKPWATPESSMEVTPSRGGRSLTPKLPVLPKGKFTNFDEAHQAITARLAAPRSASNNSNTLATPSLGSVESIPSSLDVLTSSSRPSDLVPTDQHMELARVDHHFNGRSLTASYNSPLSGSRHDDKYPKSPLGSPNATLPAFPVGLDPGKENIQPNTEESLVDRAPRETESTVENIYKRYLPSESPSSASGAIKDGANHESSSHQKGPSPGPHDDGVSDKNHKLESSEGLQLPKISKTTAGFALEKGRSQMYHSPSQPPQIPLPELPSEKIELDPHPRQSAPTKDDLAIPGPSGTSISDFKVLLNADTSSIYGDESLQYQADESEAPIPALYAPNWPDLERAVAEGGRHFINRAEHLAPTDLHARGSYVSEYGLSNRGPSSGAFTSESDDDPFKYDRVSYGAFLKPLEERQVSVALHHVGSPLNAPHHKTTTARPNSPPSPTPKPSVPLAPAHLTKKTSSVAKTSNNPFFNQMNLNQHQHSIASQAVVTDENPNQIKIAVQPVHNSSVRTLPGAEAHGLASRLEGLRGENRGPPNYDTVDDGDVGDWETVGTNVGRFDSNRFDSNRACASGSTFSDGFRIIKTTGSSVADHSDDGYLAPSFGHQSFDSGARILQHPAPGSAPESQHRRTLKDTGHPIFIPKPRFHQVNGYLQNSVRTLTGQNSSSTGSSATRYLAEKLGAPFRSESLKKKRQDWNNPYDNIEEGSRLGFRESVGSRGSLNLYIKKTRGTPRWKDEAEADEKQLEPAPEHGLACSHYAKTNQGHRHSPTAGGSFLSSPKSFIGNGGSPGATSSVVQFSFPLIPLQEAVKREALRRESGEDVSFNTFNRTRKNSSLVSSSRATQRTTPPSLPTIAKPPPTHQLRPVTAFGYHDDTQSTIRPIGIPSSSPGGIIPAVSTGTLPSPGRPVFPRSCRNPFSSVNGSVASTTTSQLPESSPHLWPRGMRRQRRNSRAHDGINLQGIVDLEQGARFGFVNEDATLSWDARKRREYYYYALCVLCTLPFFALLIVKDRASAALSWYTKGETCTLSTKQRRTVLRVAKISAMFWICVFTVLITVIVVQK